MKSEFDMSLGGERIRLSIDKNLHQHKHAWEARHHSHADFEMHIILRGSCGIDITYEQKKLHAHQAIVIAPGQYHRTIPLPGGVERFSVNFFLEDGPLLETIKAEIPTIRIYTVTDEITSVCQNLLSELASGDPFRQEMIQSLLVQLIARNFRQLNITNHRGTSVVDMSDSDRVLVIDTFFEIPPGENASAEALAAKLHISRRQLARILQQIYGMGFREKLLCARMDRASWLLLRTEKQVAEIAGEIGYTSEAAFYQAFKIRFGMTPVQYRFRFKKNGNGNERIDTYGD